MNGDPRLFVAIPVPPPLQARLQEMQQALLASSWELSLSEPEDLHLTLHYLGATPARVIDDLKRELGAVAHARRPFDLRCHGLGAFPDEEEPRVLWAGVEDPHGKLAELHQATLRVLNSYRLFKLHEQLTPHLTLARVRKLSSAWSPEPLRHLAKESGGLGRLPVEQVRLYRSREREEAGPHYECLAELALQA
jgi:2'-5' RNA ligase